MVNDLLEREREKHGSQTVIGTELLSGFNMRQLAQPVMDRAFEALDLTDAERGWQRRTQGCLEGKEL